MDDTTHEEDGAVDEETLRDQENRRLDELLKESGYGFDRLLSARSEEIAFFRSCAQKLRKKGQMHVATLMEQCASVPCIEIPPSDHAISAQDGKSDTPKSTETRSLDS